MPPYKQRKDEYTVALDFLFSKGKVSSATERNTQDLNELTALKLVKKRLFAIIQRKTTKWSKLTKLYNQTVIKMHSTCST